MDDARCREAAARLLIMPPRNVGTVILPEPQSMIGINSEAMRYAWGQWFAMHEASTEPREEAKE